MHHGVPRSPPPARDRTRTAAAAPYASGANGARISCATASSNSSCVHAARTPMHRSAMMVVVAAAEGAGERECERAAGERVFEGWARAPVAADPDNLDARPRARPGPEEDPVSPAPPAWPPLRLAPCGHGRMCDQFCRRFARPR